MNGVQVSIIAERVVPQQAIDLKSKILSYLPGTGTNKKYVEAARAITLALSIPTMGSMICVKCNMVY